MVWIDELCEEGCGLPGVHRHYALPEGDRLPAVRKVLQGVGEVAPLLLSDTCMSSWLYAVKSAGEKGNFFIDCEQLPRHSLFSIIIFAVNGFSSKNLVPTLILNYSVQHISLRTMHATSLMHWMLSLLPPSK